MEKRIYTNIPTAPPEEDRGSRFNSTRQGQNLKI